VIQCSGTIAEALSQRYKRIHVIRLAAGTTEGEAVASAVAATGTVLLDAFDAVAFGGTGKKVNWEIAARIRDRINPRPLVLAGGLTAENVKDAILQVRPFAVDVSSGIEEKPGVKDVEKMIRFCEAVREADFKAAI
jgi:phosphoribosylanthranilate isomerase